VQGKKIVRTALFALALLAATWLTLRFLLPVALPFLLAWLAAQAAEPAVRLLGERAKLPRWLAAGVSVTVLYGLLGLLLYGVCRAVCGELARFTQELPALLQSLVRPVGALREWLNALAARAPDGLGAALRANIDAFFRSGAGLAEKGYAALFSFASRTITGLPELFLFLVTTVVATFMIASGRPALIALVRRQTPASFRNRYAQTAEMLRGTLCGWLKAQGKLIGITFVLLTAGLMLLNTEFPLLFGAVIALIDALPVFGTGTVLIPWALLSFLRGRTKLGVGLLVLYGAAALTRQALEPRLIGRQIGLPPLFTLLALYAGFRLFGVPGMILFPIGAILAKQFWDHAVPKK